MSITRELLTWICSVKGGARRGRTFSVRAHCMDARRVSDKTPASTTKVFAEPWTVSGLSLCLKDLERDSRPALFDSIF